MTGRTAPAAPDDDSERANAIAAWKAAHPVSERRAGWRQAMLADIGGPAYTPPPPPAPGWLADELANLQIAAAEYATRAPERI
jgi:hypothetical protein